MHLLMSQQLWREGAEDDSGAKTDTEHLVQK